MIHLFIGSLLLSIIHALIPNHWVPLVLISRAERWSNREVIAVSAITAFSHTISTIVLGIVIGLIGFRLSGSYETFASIVAPLVLIFMGLIYFSVDAGHTHHEHLPGKNRMAAKSKAAIVVTLSTAMFFSPCLEIETYYFTAGLLGWTGIFVVSAVYLVVTVFAIVLLVSLGCHGIERFKWHFLEHHEKKVTGTVLIVLGILAFFVKL